MQRMNGEGGVEKEKSGEGKGGGGKGAGKVGMGSMVSTRVQGWRDEAPKGVESGGSAPPHNFFCFVIS